MEEEEEEESSVVVGSRRKRGLYVHTLQNKVNYFDQDNVGDGKVDTDLLYTTPIRDLYEDVGDNYENIARDNDGKRFVPFLSLPLEVREKYETSMKDLESVMEKRNAIPKESCGGRVDEDITQNHHPHPPPLKVENSHRHETMRAPSFPDTETKSPIHFLSDERRKVILLKTINYNLMENYILPKTFQGDYYECQLGNFISDLYKQTRIECISMNFNPKEGGGGGGVISCVMNLDFQDIFYISIQFLLKNKLDNCVRVFRSKNNFIAWSDIHNNIIDEEEQQQQEMEEEKNDKQIIKDAIGVLKRYYYFTCGCEK